MNRHRIIYIEMHKQRHNLTQLALYFLSFPCSFILADRLKEEGDREVIKLQTGATRRERGKEEGREEERFLERRSQQDMVKEQKTRKHRGGLSRAKVLSLQGLCISRVKQTGTKHLLFTSWHTSRWRGADMTVTHINMELITTRLAADMHMCRQKRVHWHRGQWAPETTNSSKRNFDSYLPTLPYFFFSIYFSFFCQAYLSPPLVYSLLVQSSLFSLTLLSPSHFSSPSRHRLVCQVWNRAAIVSKSAATETSNLLKSLWMFLHLLFTSFTSFTKTKWVREFVWGPVAEP